MMVGVMCIISCVQFSNVYILADYCSQIKVTPGISGKTFIVQVRCVYLYVLCVCHVCVCVHACACVHVCVCVHASCVHVSICETMRECMCIHAYV